MMIDDCSSLLEADEKGRASGTYGRDCFDCTAQTSEGTGGRKGKDGGVESAVRWFVAETGRQAANT